MYLDRALTNQRERTEGEIESYTEELPCRDPSHHHLRGMGNMGEKQDNHSQNVRWRENLLIDVHLTHLIFSDSLH